MDGNDSDVLFISMLCSVLRTLMHEFYLPQADSHAREAGYLQSRLYSLGLSGYPDIFIIDNGARTADKL